MDVDISKLTFKTTSEFLRSSGIPSESLTEPRARELLEENVRSTGVRDVLSGIDIDPLRSLAVAISIPRNYKTRAALIHSVSEFLRSKPFADPVWMEVARASGTPIEDIPRVVRQLGVRSMLSSVDRKLATNIATEVGLHVPENARKLDVIALFEAAGTSSEPGAPEAPHPRRGRPRLTSHPPLVAGVSRDDIIHGYLLDELRAAARSMHVSPVGNKREIVERIWAKLNAPSMGVAPISQLQQMPVPQGATQQLAELLMMQAMQQAQAQRLAAAQAAEAASTPPAKRQAVSGMSEGAQLQQEETVPAPAAVSEMQQHKEDAPMPSVEGVQQQFEHQDQQAPGLLAAALMHEQTQQQDDIVAPQPKAKSTVAYLVQDKGFEP